MKSNQGGAIPAQTIRNLIKNNFIVVVIDDHYKKHAANIVVSNRSEKLIITSIKKNQIWLRMK